MDTQYEIESKKRISRIKQMRDGGAKWKEIANEMGVSIPRVSVLYMYGDNDAPEGIKEEVRSLHRNQCGLCGSDKSKLHVHHIDSKKGHKVVNLVGLCDLCHRFVHKTRRKDLLSYRELMKKAKAARANGKLGGRPKKSAKQPTL